MSVAINYAAMQALLTLKAVHLSNLPLFTPNEQRISTILRCMHNWFFVLKTVKMLFVSFVMSIPWRQKKKDLSKISRARLVSPEQPESWEAMLKWQDSENNLCSMQNEPTVSSYEISSSSKSSLARSSYLISFSHQKSRQVYFTIYSAYREAFVFMPTAFKDQTLFLFVFFARESQLCRMMAMHDPPIG